MENYNIDEFNDFLYENITGQEIIDYFDKMNNQYIELKAENKITDDIMINITRFWLDVNDQYDDNIILILSSNWTADPPEVIQDIVKYIPKYFEYDYNEYIKKLDKIELKETELLFDEIWDREVRTEMIYSYLDYDEDTYYDKNLTLPKKDREGAKFDFKKELATIIYNRGKIFIKLFSGRGKFDIVSITVNGDGIWKCLSKQEVEQEYDLSPDERVISFNCEHCLRKSKEGNVIYFNF